MLQYPRYWPSITEIELPKDIDFVYHMVPLILAQANRCQAEKSISDKTELLTRDISSQKDTIFHTP